MATQCSFAPVSFDQNNVAGTNSIATGIESNQGLRYEYDFAVCKQADSQGTSWWTVLRHNKLTTTQLRSGYTLKLDGTYLRFLVGSNNTDTEVLKVSYPFDVGNAARIRVVVYNYTFYVYDMRSGSPVLLFKYADSTAASSTGDIAIYSQAKTHYLIMSYSGKAL